MIQVKNFKNIPFSDIFPIKQDRTSQPTQYIIKQYTSIPPNTTFSTFTIDMLPNTPAKFLHVYLDKSLKWLRSSSLLVLFHNEENSMPYSLYLAGIQFWPILAMFCKITKIKIAKFKYFLCRFTWQTRNFRKLFFHIYLFTVCISMIKRDNFYISCSNVCINSKLIQNQCK